MFVFITFFFCDTAKEDILSCDSCYLRLCLPSLLPSPCLPISVHLKVILSVAISIFSLLTKMLMDIYWRRRAERFHSVGPSWCVEVNDWRVKILHTAQRRGSEGLLKARSLNSIPRIQTLRGNSRINTCGWKATHTGAGIRMGDYKSIAVKQAETDQCYSS